MAVSKPSAAIFFRILLLCMRRTIYKTSHPIADAATASISSIVIIIIFFFKFLNTYTKIMPLQFPAIKICAG
jgi:hypothetical protein